MRHYEIILMIHPDQSEQEITNLIEKYKSIILESKGNIHRIEEWGRRPLAYSIKKLYKAYYILFNIEVLQKIINDLETSFRFNEVIVRSMIIRNKNSVTEPSPMLELKEAHKEVPEGLIIEDKNISLKKALKE